jgi:hypothetical protein
MAYIIWALAVYGLANAVAVLKFGQLYIHPWTDKIPVVRHVAHCCACASFWVALVASWFVFSPAQAAFPSLVAWKALWVDGAAASAVSYLLYSVAEHLDPTEPEVEKATS